MNFHKFIKELVPILKLKGCTTLPWHSRLNIYAQVLSFSLLVVWVFYIFVGINFIFSNEYKYNNLVVHSNTSLDKNKLNIIVENIKKILQKKDINIDQLNAGIYLPNNNFLFYATMLPGLQIMHLKDIAYTTGKSIYFRKVDIINDKIVNSEKYKTSLSMVISHELVHVWQNSVYGSFGPFNQFIKSNWVMEGYACYATVDKKPHLKTKKDIKVFLKKYFNSSRYSYDLWRLMVKHAIEKMHKSVDDLHLRKVDYDEVLDSLLQEYNITKEEK